MSSPAGSSGPLPRWQSLQEVPYPLRVLAHIASPYARHRADIDPARIALGTHPDHDVVLESEPRRGVGGFDVPDSGTVATMVQPIACATCNARAYACGAVSATVAG